MVQNSERKTKKINTGSLLQQNKNHKLKHVDLSIGDHSGLDVTIETETENMKM